MFHALYSCHTNISYRSLNSIEKYGCKYFDYFVLHIHIFIFDCDTMPFSRLAFSKEAVQISLSIYVSLKSLFNWFLSFLFFLLFVQYKVWKMLIKHKNVIEIKWRNLLIQQLQFAHNWIILLLQLQYFIELNENRIDGAKCRSGAYVSNRSIDVNKINK